MTFLNTDLFAAPETASYQPLADRMRPASLAEFIGQSHIVSEQKPLYQAIQNDSLHSMIFWGPPGTGKTTLALLLAAHTGAFFIRLSAVLSGVKDIRKAVDEARLKRQQSQQATILFIDEVHRFNKSQQDAFLPHVEDGTITFVGATTENPSFELNNALLSRARVYRLQSLDEDALENILRNALTDKTRGLGGRRLDIDDDAMQLLAASADGDARIALNLLEIASDFCQDNASITQQMVAEVAAESCRRFDKGGDEFYEQISALHKSVRGSDPDAALYWFCRMLDGGGDPLYIARRVVRMASEDIGNADPRALTIAMDAWDAQQRLGSPEGELAIAQAIIYLACAAKSNAVYKAFNETMAYVKSAGTEPVPVHLRNAPTRLMKELGYGHAYRYAHDEPEAYAAGEHYFPDDMPEQHFYRPVKRGMEIKIGEKLAWLKSLDQAAKK